MQSEDVTRDRSRRAVIRMTSKQVIPGGMLTLRSFRLRDRIDSQFRERLMATNFGAGVMLERYEE